MIVKLQENNINMLRFSHLYFDIDADEFLKVFEYGDAVDISVNGDTAMEVPVCGSYEDLLPGECAIIASANEDKISLVRNFAKIGVEKGILEVAPSGSETSYILNKTIRLPVVAEITIKEKGKYLEKTLLSKLQYSRERQNYDDRLTDAQFANFRCIRTTGMGNDILYRSSSPIDPKTSRNIIVDRLAKEAGIRSIINLADSEEKAMAYPGYENTYCAGCNIAFVSMTVDYKSEKFRNTLAETLRFIINNDGPYLFHCYIGKDRTGFLAALLELLMGAGVNEIQEDFLQTYENLYGGRTDIPQKIDDAKKKLIRETIVSILTYVFGTDEDTLRKSPQTVEKYLISVGLDENEIIKLKAKLRDK